MFLGRAPCTRSIPRRALSSPVVLTRTLACSPTVLSGHNRWSKIKHDKGKEDAVRNKQRTILARDIVQASRGILVFENIISGYSAHCITDFGADPTVNSRLADVITTAKRAGFPKTSIEAAIARGQGVSMNGAALESFHVEAMIPPAIAAIIECQTDSKARTMQDVREILKQHGATITSTSYMFEKRGKIVLALGDSSEEAILDHAIEAGALDVEILEEEGEAIIFTNPSQTKAVADAILANTKLSIKHSDLIWHPKQDTKVEIDSDQTANTLSGLLSEFLL
ncbi:hypothetical protein MMC09_005567 [Bachmanniomyces sp. S44760]|nr:hypothetical protein [Bachmanniomyces sp. S44760]